MHDSQLIFMISLPRSGSTMLQKILGTHPEILTRSEPWLMLHPLHALKSSSIQARYNAKLAEKGVRDFLSEIGEEQYYSSLSKCYLSLYEAQLAITGQKYFLDKTPRYFEVFDELYKTFPNAKFIILYRNPAAIMSSILQSWVKDDLVKLKEYKVDLEHGIDFLTRDFSAFPNTYSIRYEDLLENPTAQATALFEFLGIAFDHKCLRYGDFQHEPWLLGDQHTVIAKSEPDPSHVDRWHETLNSATSHKLISDYIQSLGPEKIKALGYNHQEIDSVLNQAQIQYAHPKRMDLKLSHYLVNDAEILYRAKSRQKQLEEQLKSSSEALATQITNNQVLSKVHKQEISALQLELQEMSIAHQKSLHDVEQRALQAEQENLKLHMHNRAWQSLDSPLQTMLDNSIMKKPHLKFSAYIKLLDNYRAIKKKVSALDALSKRASHKYLKKISVITVTYNAKELLEKTILSVREQNSALVEYLVIDGASSDGTTELLQRYSADINLWVSEPDNGIYDAMNKGIALANGEWIIFLNAGDTFVDSSVVDRLCKELNTQYSFVYGDRYRIQENGKAKLEIALPIEETINREAVFHQSLATKAELLKSRPYNTNYALAADFEYIVNAWGSGHKFKKLTFPIANFLSGGKSRTQHTLAKLEAAQIIARHHKGDPKKVRHNSFFKSLIRANLGFTINSGLQALKNKYTDLKFYVDTPQGKLRISSNTDASEAKEVLNFINDAFSSVDTLSTTINSTSTNLTEPTRPLFTIVTVTYNAGQLLQKTIESISAQNFKDFEYIIIDGNSSDNTLDIIKQNAKNITLWVSESDEGIYDAMNKGIRQASGKWVNFMNAGDTFTDAHVLERVAQSANAEADVLYGDRYYLKNDKRTFQKAKDISTIFERMPFGHQSTFVQSSILKKHEFNQTYKFAADYNLLMTLFTQKYQFQKLDIAICDFLAGGQSESGLRPYLESINILLNHTKDQRIIAKNAYFSAFRRINKELLDQVCGE